MAEPYDCIHDFWFGELNDEGLSAPEFHKLWFSKSDSTDRQIETQFGPMIEQAAAGKLNDWSADDRGLIALIILLDQFTRNVYRDSAQAFSADPLALNIALAAIDSGRHLEIPAIHRVFLYLPLEHSEDLDLQEQCVALFNDLVKSAGPEMEGYAQYAVAHRDVITKFGRFPHRNAILSRDSSKEELEYLATHGGF
jgi:uncharacterized protein (DUF924 family)